MVNRIIFAFTIVMTLTLVFPNMVYANNWPKLEFKSSLLNISLPKGMYLGEVATVAINSKGNIFVFHRGRNQLLELDSNGKFIREIGENLFIVPHGLKIDKYDNIWTTDQETHQVIKFNPDGGVDLVLGRRNFGDLGVHERGYTVTHLNSPSDVAFDSQENVYVADGFNFRIVKFDKNGEYIASWGKKGSKPGEFNFPHSMVVDENDILYVTDRENGRVQLFSVYGTFMEEWKNIGNPYLIYQSNKDTFWITDARRGHLLKLNKKGVVIGSYGEWGKELGDFGYGHGIAFTKTHEILVSEILNWRIQKLTPIN